MTDTTKDSSSYASRLTGAGFVAILAGAAFAMNANPSSADAAGQPINAVATLTDSSCDSRGVHLVDADGDDIACPVDSNQGQVQIRARAAAYVMGAGL